jgi:hypothetical protein
LEVTYASGEFSVSGGVDERAEPFGVRGAAELWKNEVLGRCDSTAVVYQGHLYAQASEKAKPSPKGLKCVDLATGKEVWCEKKSYDDYYGAIILVGDKLLVLMENGELTLVDASPAGYKGGALQTNQEAARLF